MVAVPAPGQRGGEDLAGGLGVALVLPGFSEGHGHGALSSNGERLVTLEHHVTVHQLVREAEGHFKAEEYEEGLETYRRVLQLDPDHGQAHGRVGYVLVGLGQLDEARTHFERQRDLGHEVSTALYNLACTASLAGDLDTAETRLREAVAVGFTNAKLLEKDSDLAALRERAVFGECLELSRRAWQLRYELKQALADDDQVIALELRRELAQIMTADGELQDKLGLGLLMAGEPAQGVEQPVRMFVLFSHRPRIAYSGA